MDQGEFDEIKEELQEVVDNRSDEMFKSYMLVREAFQQPYDWPEIDTLRHEVCLCLIFGLYQAAMTMTNHMLESFLKFSLGYKHSFDNLDESNEDRSTKALVESLKPGFEKYNSKNLYQSIEAAYKADLITDEQRDQLHVIRDAFRNAYSHADKEKIHGDEEIPVQGAHLEEGGFQVEPESIHKILELPFIHGQTQYYHAKANAPDYFFYVDSLVREVKEKLFPSASE